MKNKAFYLLFYSTILILCGISLYYDGCLLFLKYLMTYILILSISSSISVLFNKKIDCTLPISFFLITIIIYIFGLFHHLQIGVIFIFILSIFSIIYVVKANTEQKFKIIITPAFYLYTFLFFLLLNTTRNVAFVIWDEYSFWSIATKNMYYLNDFYTNSGTTLWASFYPPFPTILQYFFCKITGIYSQTNEMFSFQLFGFSLLFPFLKNVDLKKYISIFSILFCIICIPAIFVDSYFYYTIYADVLLGLISGYILFEYFTEKKSLFTKFMLFVSLFCLSLTKSTGVVFSVIILFILFLYNIKFKSKAKDIDIILISLIAILLAKFSWFINGIMTKTNYNGGYYTPTKTYDGSPILYSIKTFLKTFLGGNVENLNTTFQTFFRILLIKHIMHQNRLLYLLQP